MVPASELVNNCWRWMETSRISGMNRATVAKSIHTISRLRPALFPVYLALVYSE